MIIIWCSLAITLVIWLTTLADYSFIADDPFLFLSKASILAGTVGMCWAFILSTRLRVIETLFSGLDKVYHAHKMISLWSFGLILLHPIFQFFRTVPDWNASFALFIPKSIGPVELGLAALFLFILLIALTLWIPLPYHIWKRTHEFLILVLILAFLHTLWIDKQVNASFWLSLWIYGFFALAGISYIYTRFLYRFLGPRFSYQVEKIEKFRKTWNIYLTPLTPEKQIRHKPAQFVYVSFVNEHLRKEVHPYSISSAPNEPLRLSIKNLGDYTSQLDTLRLKDKALLFGPYGRFYEKYLTEAHKDAVFIAGGIGVTPFLSLLADEARRQRERKTYMFYCVKNESRADFHQEILSYTKRNASIIYHLCLAQKANLDVKTICEALEHPLKSYNFFLCGPLEMMKYFEKELGRSGVKNKNIFFEDFNLLD